MSTSTGLRDRAAELLPCPFCGGQPETFVEQTKAPVLYVWCGNDKCRVQPKVEDTDNELARNAWNTRALAPAGAEGWQPIETAPKDGTVIDVWRANAEFPGRSADVSFREPTDSEYWAHGSDEPDPKEGTIGNCPNWMNDLGWPLTGDEAPTHWMQKPAPPNASPAPAQATPELKT